MVEQGGVVGFREKDNLSSIAHPSPSSFTRLPSQDIFKEFVSFLVSSYHPGWPLPDLFNTAFSLSQPPSPLIILVDFCAPCGGENTALYEGEPQTTPGQSDPFGTWGKIQKKLQLLLGPPSQNFYPLLTLKLAISRIPNQDKHRWVSTSCPICIRMHTPHSSARAGSVCRPNSIQFPKGQSLHQWPANPDST